MALPIVVSWQIVRRPRALGYDPFICASGCRAPLRQPWRVQRAETRALPHSLRAAGVWALASRVCVVGARLQRALLCGSRRPPEITETLPVLARDGTHPAVRRRFRSSTSTATARSIAWSSRPRSRASTRRWLYSARCDASCATAVARRSRLCPAARRASRLRERRSVHRRGSKFKTSIAVVF